MSTPLSLRYYYSLPEKQAPQTIKADCCIYGGTSAGVIAAIQMRRLGHTAVLVEFGKNIGGMTSGGLGSTDIGNKAAVGGMAREFYRRVGKYYGMEECWKFEPSIAAKVFNDMIQEAQVPMFYEQRLKTVKMNGGNIVEIIMENGNRFLAKYFIDATYEGDLMAMSGVGYHVGRESNAVYGETLNGVQFGHPSHNFRVPVDPYRIPGQAASGLLAGISSEPPGRHGEGDYRVQAYNFRMCLTNVPNNRMPFPQPDGYDPDRYTLLLRYIQAGVWDALALGTSSPFRKSDTNNHGGFSTDNIGRNYRWPEGSYVEREAIFQDHVNYQMGLMWFLCNDERVHWSIRKELEEWGLPRDEFVMTGGWPHQLYVREARRMIADYVMTERNCRGNRVAEESVALAHYAMDSHHCQRVVIDDLVRNEGNVEVGGFPPYPVSYRAIVPKRGECRNLLVPVCLSASHITYGSIRMEPVFMVLGQSSATAAALAMDAKCAVQDVEYQALRNRLISDGQVLSWDGSKDQQRTLRAYVRAPTDQKMVYPSRRVRGPVEMCGDPEHVSWEGLEQTGGFITPGSGLCAIDRPTEVRMGWDDQHLYVGVKCREQAEDMRVKLERGTFGFDDTVDFIVVPARQDGSTDYYWLSIIPAGQVEGPVHFDGSIAKQLHDHGWVMVTRISANGWGCTFRLPFSRLGQYPVPGERWRVNIARCVRLIGKSVAQEYTTWSRLTALDWHLIDEFNLIEFQTNAR